METSLDRRPSRFLAVLSRDFTAPSTVPSVAAASLMLIPSNHAKGQHGPVRHARPSKSLFQHCLLTVLLLHVAE